jgi:hypothetical protein
MARHPIVARLAEVVAECNYAQRRLLELQIPWLDAKPSKRRRARSEGFGDSEKVQTMSTVGGCSVEPR